MLILRKRILSYFIENRAAGRGSFDGVREKKNQKSEIGKSCCFTFEVIIHGLTDTSKVAVAGEKP